MNDWASNLQPFLTNAFINLFKTKLIKEEYANRVIGVIYNAIDNGSEETVNLWYPVFCVGIASMNWGCFVEKFLPKIKKMAGLGSTHVTRNAAGNVLAAAAVIAAEKKELEKSLLSPFMQLCQDSNVVIRKTALNNLKYIIPNIEPSEVERLFFTELVEHLKDPNPWIRFIIIELFVKFHALFSTDSLNKEVVPLISKEFTNNWKDTDNWLLLNCGSVVNVLICRGFLTEDLVPVIRKFYEPALYSKDITLNSIAVNNIAPMIDMNMLYDSTNIKYSMILHEFAVGPLYQKQILKVLPEIIRVHLTHRKMFLVRPIITALMQNDCQSFVIDIFAVLSKLMPKVFSGDNKDKLGAKFQKQTLKWIKELWKQAKGDSRRYLRTLIELIPRCQESFPVEDYNNHFLWELVEVLKVGNKAEKEIGANSFCLLYLKNYMTESKNDALNRVLSMAKASSSSERLSVLEFIRVAFNHFSRKLLFEKNIVERYILLAEDKVSNVRIKFSMVAKSAAKILIYNEKSKATFKNTLNILQNDIDKDVRKLAMEANKELKTASYNETEELAKQKQEEETLKREKQVRYYTNIGTR